MARQIVVGILFLVFSGGLAAQDFDYRLDTCSGFLDKVIPTRRNCVETGWYPRVLVSGSTKASIKSIPIEFRPNRPLHFYGNTVRRKYYRGNPLPLPRDIIRTGFSLIRR